MSIYFTDLVQITPVTVDPAFGTIVEGTPFASKAYIEADSSIKYGANGEPIDPEVWVFLPAGTNIDRDYYIQITSLHGSAPVGFDAQKFKVKRIHTSGGFNASHLEVLC